MALQEENTLLQGCFSSWLVQKNGGAFGYKAGGNFYTVIRVRKNDDFDYLYSQRQYNGNSIERGDKFEYAGIYCKRDGQLYDRQYDLRDFYGDESRGKDTLTESLKLAVREAVEAAIGNDRNNLNTTEITDGHMRDNLDYSINYEASGMARAKYLSGEDGAMAEYTFKCRYAPANWTEDSLLAYILDPAAYVTAQAAAYISENQEHMLFDFLLADAVAAEYAKLIQNPLNPIHRVKRIMRAVNATPAKTVTVTICKNDIEFTFKVEAAELRRDCLDHYSDWNIVAADRRRFAELFGRNADYRPEDILRIEYSRSILYQAQESLHDHELCGA